MAQDAESAKAIRRIAIRRGLVFGAIIGALDILTAASARASLSNWLGAGSSRFLGTPVSTELAFIILPGAIELIILILLYMTGFTTYTRARRVGAGALAGLVAGGVSSLVNLLVVSVNLLISLATSASETAALLSPPSLVAATFSSLTFGLVWTLAIGAGLGALGAFVRQSVFS